MKFKTRYRIVRDSYCGYEAQYRPWWCPIWLQCFGSNTRTSVEKSREVCQQHYNKHRPNVAVEYYEPQA